MLKIFYRSFAHSEIRKIFENQFYNPMQRYAALRHFADEKLGMPTDEFFIDIAIENEPSREMNALKSAIIRYADRKQELYLQTACMILSSLVSGIFGALATLFIQGKVC